MKFYNRENELEILEDIYSQSSEYGKLTVITGRRRVGKTLLAGKFAENKQQLYFFIAKKSENLLCTEFAEQIRELYDDIVFGDIKHFSQIFEILLIRAKDERIIRWYVKESFVG